MSNKAEVAVSYAALILADETIDITSDKLQNLLQAAGIEDVEPIWTTLFAKALQGKDVKELLTAATAAAPGKGQESSNPQTDDNDGDKNDGDGKSDGEQDNDDDESDFGGLGLFDE
ncbi:hypothetical protein BDV96DRAFT_491499 [Lophiotrema nucula]|uniref:Large ribosomal subunit protein P1 n=1 Tax=Lophiotrema nucula TaxID=690887 RepID=A0A6A5Z9C3_9PLEO|nr:hypothetical protein BDV96DRAFT_491499 [Lophiotrema nucula]